MFRCLLLFLLVLQLPFLNAYEPWEKRIGGDEEKGMQGMRYPCFSPDGKWIAFSLHGDLWKAPAEGGRAHRLTLHEADDVKPRWSPDGKTIAFSSDRMGNFDVWTIPSEGGVPTQITFHGSWDSISDWSRDGEWIVFYSYRSGGLELWKMKRTGGVPMQLTFDGGRDGMISPDGSRMVYCRGDASLWIKGYKGSSNWDIYSTAFQSKETPIRLTEFDGNDLCPFYSNDGKSIYFLREQTMSVDEKPTPVYNLWRMDANGQNQTLVTQFSSDVMSAHPSFDGQKIVIEKDFQLWEVNLADGKEKRIPIEIASDDKSEQDIRRIVSDGNEMGDWSPDGREIAFSLHGDIWIMPALGGKARQITSGSSKDEWPRFSPDGKSIAYCSNKSGNSDIFVLELKSGKEKQLTDHKSDDFYHAWSPDGKKIVFTSERSGNRDIFVVSSQGGIARQLTNSPESEDDAVFSPDGKWIAFDSGKNGNQEIWIMPAEGPYSEARQLTQQGGLTQVPTWSADGKWIAYETNNDLGQSSVWVISVQGGKGMQIVPEASLPRWSPDGKWILFESDRLGKKNLYRTEAPSYIRTGDRIPFFAEVDVDLKKERIRVFDEAWAAIQNGFYDPKLHGVDWEKIKERYRPLVETIQTDLELNVLINRMVGELRSSHMGITGIDKKNKVSTGELGWTLKEVPGQNAFQVEDVLKDGPADKAWVRKGDYVFQVEDVLLSPTANIDQLFKNTVGKNVKIFISPTLNPREGRYVMVKPICGAGIAEIQYRHWLMDCIQTVKTGCQGKVLYFHLKEMDLANLKRFRDIVQKGITMADGMILDVRNNGGGNIHQELLDILMRRPYVAYRARDQKVEYQPSIFWHKPVVVLINERSFSDAEVFPYAFKMLRRGYLVGVPTSGGVIGTRDITLSNQSTFRVPRVGYYALDGVNMEGMGVQPDFLVPETPKDRAEGKDPQLLKAIEVVLNEIEARKKAQTVPTPPPPAKKE